jgi:hypothetical protein
MEGGGQGGGHLQELQELHSTSIILPNTMSFLWKYSRLTLTTSARKSRNFSTAARNVAKDFSTITFTMDICSALSTIAMVDMGSTETLHNQLGCEYMTYNLTM